MALPPHSIVFQSLFARPRALRPVENRCAGALVLYIESALPAAFGRAPRYGDVAVAERCFARSGVNAIEGVVRTAPPALVHRAEEARDAAALAAAEQAWVERFACRARNS